MKAFEAIREQLSISEIQFLPRIATKKLARYSKDKIVTSVNFRSFLQAAVSSTMLLFHAYQNKKFLLIDNELLKQQKAFKVVCKIAVSQSNDSKYLRLGDSKIGEDVYSLIQYFFNRRYLSEKEAIDIDLYQGFQELLNFLQQNLEDGKLAYYSNQKMLQEMCQNCWIFRQLLLSQRLKNKLFFVTWLSSLKQKFQVKLNQLEKRIIERQKSGQNLNSLIRSFFIASEFPIQVNYSKTVSGKYENLEVELQNMNRIASQYSNDRFRLSFTEFKFSNNKDKQSQIEIIKLKKLSQQISIANSQLIDYTDCQQISKKFYNKFFKNYLKLVSFGIQCQGLKENRLNVQLKIRCQISLTKLDYLELQKTFNQIINNLTAFNVKDSMDIMFDDRNSKVFIISCFSHELSIKCSLIEAILKNLDQLLIMYACIDSLIIFYSQKSIRFCQKSIEEEQIQIITNQKELENITERFVVFLNNYRNKVKRLYQNLTK